MKCFIASKTDTNRTDKDACSVINSRHSISSLFGPKRHNHKLSRVRLLAEYVSGVSCVIFVNLRNEYIFNTNLPRNFRSLCLYEKVDGSMRRVLSLKWGKRCLGHGTNLNSCGTERRKFITWGVANNKTSSDIWPRMPVTARVIPAK